MPDVRKMKLGVSLGVPGHHPAGWRHPDAVPETDMDFGWYSYLTQRAERAKFDTILLHDTTAASGSDALAHGDATGARRSHVVRLEPTAALAGLAALTTHIGLIALADTTSNEPFNIARRFASLDLISGGRSGWDLGTSQREDAAPANGGDAHIDHATRAARAREFHDVVVGLWDSWDEDALLRDKASGVYFDRAKLHVLDHAGAHFRVRGPLNVVRSPQGRPVVAQSGASETARDLAARTADIVFTAQTDLDAAQQFYADLKARAARHHRAADDIKIMLGITPVIGATMAQAQAQHALLQSLLPDDLAQPARAHACAAEIGHRVLVGTPEDIADEMAAWFHAGAADGFNIICNHYPKPLEDFCDLVVPALRRRGVFRTEYEGVTLRANLGLKVPTSRYAVPA